MRPFILPLLLAFGLAACQAGADSNLPVKQASPDDLLGAALEDIHASRTDSALANLDRAIAAQPDFKLAYLVKGDLLMAKSGNLTSFGSDPSSSSKAVEDLKDEARVRLLNQIDQPDPAQLPAQVLQMSPSQPYVLLADAAKARLYVLKNRNGEPYLVQSFYLSLGKKGVGKESEGDKRSPLGVYNLARAMPRNSLTPFYGAGAFPLDYPNDWDQAQGRTGHGIWLHGVPPDTYSRPPKTSDGCLVVTNPDWHALARYIFPGSTPVVISDRVEWLDRDAWQARRQAVLGTIEDWKNAWQRRDANAYFSHYSRDYLDRLGLPWREAKERNIVQKDWIKVDLGSISLFQYGSNMAVLDFTQNYNSDKLSDVTHKLMFLRQEGGQWQIALEKAVQPAPALSASN